jgi:predicted 2-oxoglutarate/Fe(II)-dependent dioxygenase YbiX
VAGVGLVALPLDKRQAAALKKRARQAPYGKGTQTVIDTDVRRVWEINADQIVLANPEWRDVLKQAVGAGQSELGLEKQNLEAHLYKLLLYEPGSFFLAHRDGEKLDRMVATLVIALPSAHEGGELVVRHEGREATVDFSPKSQFQTQFAAFYADCEHEIRPVTSGFRLALVYNLTLEKSKRTITAPTSREYITAAARFLREVVPIFRTTGGRKIATLMAVPTYQHDSIAV